MSKEKNGRNTGHEAGISSKGLYSNERTDDFLCRGDEKKARP